MQRYRAWNIVKVASHRSREERREAERKREESLNRKTLAELEISPLRFSFGRPMPQVVDSIDMTTQSNDIKAQFGKLWRKSLGSQDSNCAEHD